MGGCFSKPPNAAKNVSAASAVNTPKAGTAVADGKLPPASGNKKGATSEAVVKAPTSSSSNVLGVQTEDVTSLFALSKILGKGQFGTTRVAEEKSTGHIYACKSIAKRKLQSPEDVEDVRREVQIMHHLAGHPHITRLKGAYEDRGSVHIVMELCSGGELFDRIVARGHYTWLKLGLADREKTAAAMIRTIVQVVAHCHSLGVMHRDLKPENFLLSDKGEMSPLKATDFGLSVFYKPGQVFTDVVGSAYYVAPEVLRKKYGKEADLWSCGVMLYILLSGVPPFWGETEQQIFSAILEGNLDFSADPWPAISKGAKDAVRSLLQQDPHTRATADQILHHPWMRENGTATDQPLDNVILSRMRAFAGMNKLKKEALRIIATGISAEEIAGLRAIFQAIDKDNSGTITSDELEAGMKNQGTTLDGRDLRNLLASIDVDSNGSIDYEEFLASTVSTQHLEKEETMRKAFQHFDADNSGYITREELHDALQMGGPNAAKEIEKMINEVDIDKDGKIDYKEFCQMMRKGEALLEPNPTMRDRGRSRR